jgi:hypothetical protein
MRILERKTGFVAIEGIGGRGRYMNLIPRVAAGAVRVKH